MTTDRLLKDSMDHTYTLFSSRTANQQESIYHLSTQILDLKQQLQRYHQLIQEGQAWLAKLQQDLEALEQSVNNGGKIIDQALPEKTKHTIHKLNERIDQLQEASSETEQMLHEDTLALHRRLT